VVTRQEWAAHLIRRGGADVPTYGSPEWLALPDGHPVKLAGLVIAAECWAQDGDDLERRLRTEVLAVSREHKRSEDAEYVAQIRAGYDRQPDAAEIEAEFWAWIRGDAA
jgi:hypothetical protein